MGLSMPPVALLVNFFCLSGTVHRSGEAGLTCNSVPTLSSNSGFLLCAEENTPPNLTQPPCVWTLPRLMTDGSWTPQGVGRSQSPYYGSPIISSTTPHKYLRTRRPATKLPPLFPPFLLLPPGTTFSTYSPLKTRGLPPIAAISPPT